LALRLAPARLAYYARAEVQQRPLWSAVRLLLLLAAYLALAYWQGGWPFWRWERVAASPVEQMLSLEVRADNEVIVGTYAAGAGMGGTDGSFAWLPTDNLPNAGSDDAPDYYAISDIAYDSAYPDGFYAAVWDHGPYRFDRPAAMWQPLGDGSVPTTTVAIDTGDGFILTAALDRGVFGSEDAGESWVRLSDGLPEGEYVLARFAPDGAPYVGGAPGLYRGRGAFPWQWEQVPEIEWPLYLDIGPDGTLYVAYPGPGQATQLACFNPESKLKEVSTDLGIITAVLGHPTAARLLYASTIGQVYEVQCSGERQGLDDVPGIVGAASDMALLTTNEGTRLLVATSSGIYQRQP
jgi:hypothetical protein